MNLVWEKLESKTLVWGGAWDDVKSTVRAQVFGTLVELTRDRVKHYTSDLFHDALWIEEHLNGPGGFDWVARECGTFIGEVTHYLKTEDWSDAVKYRFNLREEDQKWTLDVYQAVPMGTVLSLDS